MAREQPVSYSLAHPRSALAYQADWGGTRIVVPPVARAKRILPGARGRATSLEMDVRGFVPSSPSSVVTRWTNVQLESRSKRQPKLRAQLAARSTPGWLDVTAHLLADIVFDEIAYRLRRGDAWQLPEETLALGEGDCEDRATLLASALVAAGISPYNVRVALGTVSISRRGGKPKLRDHAWVVYRDERGYWVLLEPPPPDSASSQHHDTELCYRPDYVFNGDHQWSCSAEHDARFRRQRWNSFDPQFHGEVHRSIVDLAARAAGFPSELRSRIARTFTVVPFNVIDPADRDFRSYDPREHFDSGLIAESWRTVLFRAQKFREKPLGDPEGLVNGCFAAHGIADFYAHSTYAHFLATEKPGQVTPFDPETGRPALAYDYAADPTFARTSFTHYAPWYKPTDFERLQRWRGRPISGRYSFENDTHDPIERVTNVPPSRCFPSPADRSFAGSLPHHFELAVDERGSHTNRLYTSAQYEKQFKLRHDLALAHITRVFKAHPDLR